MTVAAVVYDESGAETYEEVGPALRAAGTTWIRVVEPTPAELERVREAAGVHPLSVEDVQNGVRPKVERFDTHTFLLVKDARLTRGESTFEEELEERSVGVFLGWDWLLTLTYEEVDAVEQTWGAVDAGESRLRQRGPDFAAYRIVDRVVDGYFGLLDGIEDRIERFEEEVVEDPDRGTLVEINDARRELLSVRKLLWPTREAVGVLSRGDAEEVREPTEKYYRDVYDHLVQLVDLVETYRDLAASARDIYLNALSVSTNEVMKTLTVVATIVLPLTFVVGVYGMNFGESAYNMPELGWTFGYPAVMLGMGLTTAVLVTYFRQQGWL